MKKHDLNINEIFSYLKLKGIKNISEQELYQPTNESFVRLLMNVKYLSRQLRLF